jgi:hypothetical protein
MEKLHIPSPLLLKMELGPSLRKITLEESSPSKTKQDMEVDLPPGWEARKTSDGQIYYVNHNTKTTTWVPPGERHLPPERETKKTPENQVSYANHITKTATGVPLSQGDLPPGWEARQTPDNQTYYVDHSTKTTTWIPPTLVPAKAVIHLPTGWESRRNAEGRIYFIDHNTQTTTWAQPAQTNNVGSLTPGWEEKRTADGRVYFEDHNTCTTTWFPPPAADKDKSSPSSSGKLQYKNAVSTTKSPPTSEQTFQEDQSNCHSSIDEAESTFSPLVAYEALTDEIRNAYPEPPTGDKKSSGQESVTSSHNAPCPEEKLDNFKYTPLSNSSRFIRLLYVGKAESYADVLECRLETFPVEDLRDYVALSYVWGKPVFNTVIICNDKRFDITLSLSLALRQYRRTRRCAENTPIWADAICIDQADKTEVRGQISLMNRIYSQASEVFAYLGQAPAEWTPTHALIYMLSHTYDHVLQNGVQGRTEGVLSSVYDSQNRVLGKTEDEFCRYYSLPGRHTNVWEQFINFSSSPWFVRTWIIQEVALARSVTLFYGRYPIAWKIFSKASKCYNLLNRQFGTPRAQKQDPLGSWNSLGVGRLSNICEAVRPPMENRDTLIYFLTQTATEFLTTCPRDKIIGILGLFEQGPTFQRTAVLADSNNTVDEVYHKTAVHLVDLGAAHVMIRFAGLSRQNVAKQIPSWVPDWSAQTTDFGTPAEIRRLDDTFCAASHLESQIYLEGRHEAQHQHSLSKPLPKTLIVSGAVIDSIKFISQFNSSDNKMFSSNTGSISKSNTEQNLGLILSAPKYSHSYTTFKSWYSSATACLQQASKSIASIQYDDAEEAFARTLIFNNVCDAKKYSGHLTPIQNVVESHDEVIAALKADQNFYFRSAKYNAMETYFTQALTCYQLRSFVVTEKGYMAMVPETTVEGDKVALFCGSPTLVILRDVEPKGERNEAKLVGEAYVHGLMEGQLKDRQDDLRIREIALV